jgi:hypothetical protein
MEVGLAKSNVYEQWDIGVCKKECFNNTLGLFNGNQVSVAIEINSPNANATIEKQHSKCRGAASGTTS